MPPDRGPVPLTSPLAVPTAVRARVVAMAVVLLQACVVAWGLALLR